MTLTGAGVLDVTPGTTRLYVHVDVFPPEAGFGRASPVNWYGLGLLRLGITGYFYADFPIAGAQIVVDVPADVDQLGYSLFGPTQITVTENTVPPPPGAEVHTSVDGTTVILGAYLDIIWTGITTADVNDRVTIQPTTATDIHDRAAFSSNFWVYANSNSSTPGPTPVTDGSCHNQTEYTGDFTDPYHARYYFAGSDTTYIHGPDFTISGG